MKINGEQIKTEQKMTIGQMLEKKGYRRERVAVEINGEIVSKAEYDERILDDEDTVEVVSFVGGG